MLKVCWIEHRPEGTRDFDKNKFVTMPKTEAGTEGASRKNPRWMSAAIQALTLMSALIVNFLVPIAYGVEAYGHFIQVNILVLVIQKFADIVIEPLMSSVESNYLFVTALLTSALVLLIAQWINYFDPIGSQGLLVVMLLSSNCMVSMFALKLHRQLLLHLILVLGVFFILLGCDRFGLKSFTLSELLIWTNLVPALLSTVGLFRQGSQFPPAEKLGAAMLAALRLFPRNVSTTLVFNCLTNIFPYVLSKEMNARDVGMFRIITAILQSATSLFPINAKAILAEFVEGKDRPRKIYTVMAAALLYFSLIGVSALLVAYFWPKLAPYMQMIAILPVLYWAVLLERYMLAAGMIRPLIVINLVIGLVAVAAVFFVKELKHAELLYALGLSVYACALLAHSQLKQARVTAYAVIVSSVLALWVETILPGTSIVYMCLIVAVSFVFMKFRLSDMMTV